MLDITNCFNDISLYGGSEIKRTFFIDKLQYMVKFSDIVIERNRSIIYLNNQYSEYIGSHIFKLLNFDTQDTKLVKCNIDGKTKIGVACLDFLQPNDKLFEFKNLSYSLNSDKRYTNDINDIFDMIKLLNNFEDKEKFEDYFYEVFVVDTLIGNVDRHLGNWAVILRDGKYKLSPIYDCGSSLHPLLSLNDIHNLFNNDVEFKNVAINLKTAYRFNDKSMTYLDFYKLMPNKLETALNKIYPLIDMTKIKKLIDDIEVLTDEQKDFYYKSIKYRKEFILDKYYKQINK